MGYSKKSNTTTQTGKLFKRTKTSNTKDDSSAALNKKNSFTLDDFLFFIVPSSLFVTFQTIGQEYWMLIVKYLESITTKKRFCEVSRKLVPEVETSLRKVSLQKKKQFGLPTLNTLNQKTVILVPEILNPELPLLFCGTDKVRNYRSSSNKDWGTPSAQPQIKKNWNWHLYIYYLKF